MGNATLLLGDDATVDSNQIIRTLGAESPSVPIPSPVERLGSFARGLAFQTGAVVFRLPMVTHGKEDDGSLQGHYRFNLWHFGFHHGTIEEQAL